MGKIKNLSLKEKHDAIRLVTVGRKKVQEVAEIFQCGKTQIYDAIKNKDSIADKIEQGQNVSKKKLRKEINENLNQKVYEWFCAARSKNFPVSGPMLKEKAREIAAIMKIENFSASSGWLDSFKANKRISFHVSSGESNDVDEGTVHKWKSSLAEKIKNYDLKNIANADETALFFRMMPNKTMQLKGEKCFGGKLSKERLSILLTVFADGKLAKPLVIGKSNKPRCFKNLDKSQLPVTYRANSKAWMTASIFTEYLEQLNQQMIRENRKILLFIDNATCHPKLKLSNVKIVFFPPNCTSVLQPLDNGVIQCAKLHYRKLMLKKVIAHMDTCHKASDVVKEINVLDAIMIFSKALEHINGNCVMKCFKNCGFPFQCEDFTELFDANELQELINISEPDSTGTRASDYNAIDNDVMTETASINIEDIINNNNVDQANESDGELEESTTAPSPEDVLVALKVVKNYTKIKGCFSMFDKVEQLEFQIESDLQKQVPERKQTKISKYFLNQK